ncbi:MAG: S41 family peptidase [Bacteroidetes bacterium]|nr:S41 family peptidase [Bacteroidota bacterium]
MGNNKSNIALPIIVASVLILLLFASQFLFPSIKLFGDNKQSTFQQIVTLVNNTYVDTIDLGNLKSTDVDVLLKKLDPHSSYLNPAEVAASAELLNGHFEGIGVEFGQFRDTATITYVIPSGPGEKAGLKSGDQLLIANDHLLYGKSISTDSIRSLVRGKRNSWVDLTVRRNQQTIKIPVQRALIPLPAISAFYLIEPHTGYIRLERFSATSYEEFMQALESLKKQGAQQLVLDLRGNGGGLLAEAIDIADEFLDQDKLIVYTEGEKVGKQEFRARRPGLFEKGKIVLLIDEFSASASEVLAGAIQDWCRGTVIGQQSFGKGLVQEEYTLSSGAALRLTVARYFTPLGRCIQLPYNKENNTLKNHRNFINSCGDTLQEENGITPQLKTASNYDSTILNSINLVYGLTLINQFTFPFYLDHASYFNNKNSPLSLLADASLINTIWNKWISVEPGSRPALPIYSAQEKKFLMERLLATIARYKWRDNGYFQILNTYDNTIRLALKTINTYGY